MRIKYTGVLPSSVTVLMPQKYIKNNSCTLQRFFIATSPDTLTRNTCNILYEKWYKIKTKLKCYISFRTLFSLLPMIFFYIFYTFYKPIYCNLRKKPPKLMNDNGYYYYYPFLKVSEQFDQIFFSKLPHIISNLSKCFIFDLLATFPYIVHGFLYFICSLKYAFKREHNPFFFAFLNIAGYSTLIMLFIQYLVPVAPPWFVDHYYDKFDSSVIYTLQCCQPNEYTKYMNASIMAGNFYNIDKLTKFWIFQYIYTHSIILFGALPSMHVGLALAALETEYLCSNPNRFTIFYTFWMIWAAIYSNHHYILDIIVSIIIVRLTSMIYCYINGMSVSTYVKSNITSIENA